MNELEIQTIRASSLSRPALTLDAKHYQQELTLAQARIRGCGIDLVSVADLADCLVPNRVKLVTVSDPSAGVPYLKAHDAFYFRPSSNRYVPRNFYNRYDDMKLRPFTILTPSSGRNLGPTTFVGKYLSQFAMTDIIRIVPREREDAFFLYAYLLTPTATALIRRGRTGTNVDHLSPNDMEQVLVPWPDRKKRKKIAEKIEHAISLLDDACFGLGELERELHKLAGLEDKYLSYISSQRSGPIVFDRKLTQLSLRIDAAFYEPRNWDAASAIMNSGTYSKLSDIADLRMLGRYKRYYVSDAYGRPIISGRQLLQRRPVALKFISDRSFKEPDSFVIRKGWSLFTCDGRSEEALATPAYVPSLRDGWLASNHVMRAVPKDGMNGGYLYLSLSSPLVQAQLKARATGSVVDGLDPQTVSDVVLPVLDQDKVKDLGQSAADYWEKMSEAVNVEDECSRYIENLVAEGYERAA